MNEQRKTKEKNTFRFKSFADRVSEIDIRRSALYYIGHENEELAEDDETYFHQTIKKWTVLNLTDEYNQFSKKCHGIVTLPQLLHKTDFVVDLLLEKLSTATNLSLQPLLEILAVLSKDLREEFYPHFQRVLDRLICLLNTKDPDQLEWTLICLAYIFKALKPFLKRNISVVFHAILPLLDENRYAEEVTNFAVECFSFISRDLKDFNTLLEIILGTVQKEQTQSVRGCGRLFFEIVRGTKGLFHSVAEKFLQFLFEGLLKTEDPDRKTLLYEIVCAAVKEIVQFIHPHNAAGFWLVICQVMTSAMSEYDTANLNYLVLLMIEAAGWRNGSFLSEIDTIVSMVVKVDVDDVNNDDEEFLLNISKLVSMILLSSNAKISQLDTSRMIKKIMQIGNQNVFESFTKSMVAHSQFEILVLPNVMRRLEEHFDLPNLQLVASVILEKAPSVQKLNEWKQYPLPLKKMETLKRFDGIFMDFKLEDDKEKFLAALVVAPHIRGLTQKFVEAKCKLLTVSILNVLKDTASTDEEVNKSLLMLLLVVDTAIHLEFHWPDDFLADLLAVVLPHCRKATLALRILDRICSFKPHVARAHKDIHPFVAEHLSSPISESRLLSTHCLSSIYKSTPTNPYKILHDIESITPTVHTYREIILLLQKLETNGEYFKSIENDAFKVDILRFLMGMLYHNFKLLWEPVLNLIQEYSTELSMENFWGVYGQQLQTTAGQISKLGVDTGSAQHSFHGSLFRSLEGPLTEKPADKDVLNYRNLIWSRIPKFGQIREVKNRELVTLFLEFVNNEFKQKKLYTWDISTKGEQAQVMDVDEDEDEEELEPRAKVSTKVITDTLMSMMSIFVNQRNPKQLHREPEIYAFYMELLSGNNPALQKLALDCVISYKNKSLLPYKDHLYAMIDENKFKDELISFKIDRSAGTIQENHRKQFMEILLRILYGKMTAKVTSKKGSSQVRKGTVLRFLAGCSTEEIMWFLRMAFGIYDEFLECAIEDIPAMVHSRFSVKAVWSPKKLQSTINLLELIRKQFGGLMEDDFLIYMLKLISFVGAACNEVIVTETKIESKMTSIYKNVKNLTLLSLVNFFEHFEGFPWTKGQIVTLSEIFVWGTVEKLPQDSIHSPTPVLKLLIRWSENAKLYVYLTAKKNGVTVFQYVVELLLNDKSKVLVRKPIMGMIERLLTINGDDQEVSGIDVIKPHILQILDRLKMNFSAGAKNARRRNNLDKSDLNILSLLTQHVDSAEACDSLLQLLLPILISKSQSSASEDVICQVITTLSNLIKRLDAPETYLRKIAPLFEQVQEVSARKMLCQLLMDIAKRRNSDSLKEIARIIDALNAWDRRWVEQPDYDKRLDALKLITLKLEGEEIGVDIDLGVLVIYNCFHFIKYDKDMGLRDNASEHLRSLVPKLIQKYEKSRKDVDYLVGDVLLNLVRRAIRDSNENVRNEGIRLLGEMVRKCSSSHQVLGDMFGLVDLQDPEVDFFENVTHIQSHRHGRALLKFCNVAKTLKAAPNQRTLTQFIMPLISRYLLNERHAGKHTLVDAAIEALGVVCQLLPWQHYQAVLKYYLQKMRTSQEHQKHAVRIVVRILDAFHFDLTQSSAEQSAVEALKKELTEKEEKEPTETDKEKEGVESDEDDLDSELADIKDDEEEEKTSSAAILDNLTVLPKNAAKRVMHTIATILIPTLNRSITEKSSYDAKHKVNRKRFSAEREEEEILRVPIGLALVKLLQKLPKEILDTSLPGVFMKVCTFLRSPLKSVRMLTRDILKKIILTLGSGYLAMLLDHLLSLLTRGFQVHVLSVTVHGVLDALRDVLKPGDIESCLGNILEVSLNDIFGELAAEKEVEKIAAHTPEAKPSAKSFLVLHIVARNIQESCMLDILMPFKEYLTKSQSKKMTMKIQECFQKIVTGLVENPHISRESLLIFIYGTMSESIPDLLPGTEKRILTENEKEKMRRARPDCFIIEPEPKFRAGAVRKTVKNNAQANAHILIEFGLEMLHIVLKRKKLVEIAYEPFLNPVLPLVRDSLKSTHIRVTTFALKCVTSIWNEGYVLPEFKNYLEDIVTRLFEILNNFSTFGATKQEENMQLMKNAFKCVVALLRKCDYELNNTQIDQLIYCIEHDLHEGGNQTMAFSLLKAIVNRKIDTPELHEVMLKIREITIVSQSDFAREESRAILLIYMMEYTLKKKVETYLKFFTRQLSYSLPSGRMSAIQYLTTVVKKFPLNVLAKKSEFLFISLGTRLVNDDIPECRKAVAEGIELLIARLDSETRQKLFDVALLFLQGEKPSIREMAAMLCSRFLAVEKESFESRVKVVLPILVSRLMFSNPNAPGRFVKAPNANLDLDDDDVIIEDQHSGYGKKHKRFHRPVVLTEEEIEINRERKQRAIDHELIQMQHCILKILEFCPDILNNEQNNQTIDELAYESQKLLGYEHEWVRVNSAKILGHILSTYDFALVGEIITKAATRKDTHRDYIYLNPEQDIKSLVLDLCAQVVPGDTNQQMMDEIVKVFLFVANMLRDVPFDVVKVKKEEDDDAESDRSKINLNWLVKNMRFLVNKEVALAPHSCIARSSIFVLIEGLTTLLDTDTVTTLGFAFLSMLVREMSEEDQNVDADLRQQATRLGNKLRKRIGSDVYDKLRTAIQMKLMMRRAERKKVIAQEKINDPVRAAKRKQGIQERKKTSKKRKVDVIRGKAAGKVKRKRKAEEDVF